MNNSSEYQIKLDVVDLAIGMYVSKLDRPWTDTHFLFQGFRIESEDEIKELQQCCNYVYIDKEKSTADAISRRGTLISPAIKVSSKSIHAPPETSPSPTSNEFRQHMTQAIKAHTSTKTYIENVMQKVQRGKEVDIHQAKSLVSELATNLIQNPTALMWLTQLKERDQYTSTHALNVCVLSLFFGRSLGLETRQLENLGVGALLHDIGKLKVPADILNKPARLTNDEFEIVKKHTTYGYELLKHKDQVSPEALDIVRHHHERVDGEGYPGGMQKNKISYYSKIVKIVDVYDAVTSKRVYSDEVSPYEAINCIYSDRNAAFEEELVQGFIRHMGVYPIGTSVELNTGEIGVVTAVNKERNLSPTLLLVLDKNKQPISQRKYINLASNAWKEDSYRPVIKQIINPNDYDIEVSKIFSRESIFAAYSDNATPDNPGLG